MRYGYFDDANREYVIERPDTPTPWSNYLGDRRYGSILSNNGAGYSFTRSPALGRITRYSYTAPLATQPWRGFYLRDGASGDHWSTFWQPVAKPLGEYDTVCRMGTGYLTVDSRYSGIRTVSTYFVPLDQSFEYWVLEVHNEGPGSRELDLFSFAEFTSEWHIQHDVYNRQYTEYIVEAGSPEPGLLSQSICGRLKQDDDFSNRDQSRWVYMGLRGDIEVAGFDCDRDAFIGAYGSYAAPEAVIKGKCGNSSAYGGQSCGVIQGRLSLAAGEKRTVMLVLGAGKAETVGKAVLKEFGNARRAAAELEKLKAHWAGLLETFQCETPDAAVNSTVNVWNAYNALMTFEWSRSCSLVYSGMDRDGFGFRDTVQDFVASTSLVPGPTRERLLLMLSGQEAEGGAQPEVDPVHFKPGQMQPAPLDKKRADDCMWFFNAIQTFISETGESSLLSEVVPFADKGEATVLEHLRRAIEFNLKHRGRHGLVCGLSADWNDCIRLGEQGETVFVTFQLRYGLDRYIAFAELAGEQEEAAWAQEQLAEVDKAIQAHCWDGEWWRRAYAADGMVFGGKECAEGRIFLNPQTWSVISGAASPAQAKAAMDSVETHLAGDYGIQICDPGYRNIDCSIMRAVLMNPGMKENGGIFSHTQPWAVLADCLLGNGDRAFKHLMAYLPAAQNDKADIRQIEPYVHCQSTMAPQTPHSGRSKVPWLSGTVAWTYFVLTQYVLGIRPELDGLRIDPCIPSNWPGFTVERVYRGKRVRIRVENPGGRSRGVSRITLSSGKEIVGNLISVDDLCDGMQIRCHLC
ncbi:MAG: GH36-type glycosyl hydrolase domain-containing protein [Oceanipulchritudo sp.]